MSDGRAGLPILFEGSTRCPEHGMATVSGFYRPARMLEDRPFQQRVEARTIHCEDGATRP
jgi:hypothetical protein